LHQLEVSELFGMLVVMLVAAKVMGELARRVGQPAVLGELIGGTLVGVSALRLVDPHVETIHMLSELGVAILLLAIGLETDLKALLRVGWTSLVVAVVGVALPFALGYAACRMLGMESLTSIMAGATLTATSVGITARVLADLGRLRDVEGQIILGAAVFDDILGLVILTVVASMAEGGEVGVVDVAKAAGAAFGFLAAALMVGSLVLPRLSTLASRIDLPGTPTIFALTLALGLAWLAEKSGSALIIGAFVAGMLLAKTERAHEIEKGITALGHFFVPLFFTVVGASVDLGALNPLHADGRSALVVGSALIACGVVGKVAAGFAPFWFRGDKRVVGVGMIPRGEVGLIFAQMGLNTGVFDAGLFGGVTLMVIVTTFLAPPWLKALVGNGKGRGTTEEESEGIDDLVNDA
jgi:Kef-type K+ transport system membrane component KefB